jgi:hypothetical protein
MVEATATLANEGIEDGFSVGLISNGALSNSDQPFRIQPGRSPKQRAHLLETLAGVTPLVTAQFDRYLIREASRIPFGASLVVLSATHSLDLAETLVHLKRHGRRITLLSFADEPPGAIPGVRIRHIPMKR